jgi:DTW domain-containing protein
MASTVAAARPPVLASEKPAAECPRCLKPEALCACGNIAAIGNRIGLLILQHPQEQDRMLGTARLALLHFENAALKIGLSWPSLAKALGRPADAQRWAVLYLGSARAPTLAPGREIVLLDRKGLAAHPDPEPVLGEVEGVVVLDGSWAQAKALWWRNPWLLKCRRIVLAPKRPSRYGKLRREPRRDGLATIEAVGLVLARLEGKPEIEQLLERSFERMLDRYRAARASGQVPLSLPPARRETAADRSRRPRRRRSG